MRALIFAVVVAACSSKAAPPPNVKSAEEPKAPANVKSLDELISRDAVGVFRQTPDMFFVLSYARPLIDERQRCWTDLVRRLQAGYQISVAGDSYFIAEGDLPREEVLRCVPLTFKDGPKVHDDGDLVRFETPIGNAFAAWRGRFIVFGNERLVRAALEPSAETARRWRPLIAPFAGSSLWMTRIDHSMDLLIGAETTDVTFVVDKLEKQPKLFMAGRYVAHYKSATAAQKALAYIRTWSGNGRWPTEIPAGPDIVALFDRIAVAVGKMKMTQTGSTVEIVFDSDQLGGMEAVAAAIQSAGEAIGSQQRKP